MVTISLCMIVKNEEEVLARCLNSVKDLVDEIIIVDTGSTDSTRQIAREFTNNVFEFPWIDDFSAARNFAFSKATMDYMLWLDADDVLLPRDQALLQELKETLSPRVDIVMCRYNVGFDEENNPTFSYYRERIVKNHAGLRFTGAVHEAIAPTGTVVYSDFAVTHKKLRPGDPDRNLRIFEKLLASGKALDPREQFYYARELTYHNRDQEAAEILTAFLDDSRAWVENSIEGCRLLAQCYERLGDDKASLHTLLRSLEFDLPRAELCCDVGQYFLNHGQLHRAVYWYELALTRPRNDRSGGFVLPDCYDYIPYLQLCVLYDRLGDKPSACQYNEKAAAVKPNSPACRYNREYFDKAGIHCTLDESVI